MEDKLKFIEDLKKRLVALIDDYKTTFGKNKPNNATAKPADKKSADTKPAENKPAEAQTNPAANLLNNVVSGTLPATEKPANTSPETSKSSGGNISGSVGQGGKNSPEDTKTVQNLLNKNGASPALVVDGVCGPKTIAAISQFQSSKLGFSDGLVEVNKKTWNALNGASETKPADATNTPADTKPADATTKPADTNTKPVTPSTTLSDSVGEGGKNKPEDVALVKTLINKFILSFNLSDQANLTLVGKDTITAIKKFQKEKVGLESPDGRIDAGGKSWKVLSGEVKPTSTSTGGGKFADALPNGKLIYEDEAVKINGQAFITEVKAMAQRLKINPNFIMATMKIESKFVHTKRNYQTGIATGLIQFMPDTAAGLGTTTDALAAMSAMEQLKYVEKYYNLWGSLVSKIKEPAEAYFLVFYPAAVGEPDSYVIGTADNTIAAVARENSGYDLNGDGQVTKGEVLEYQRKNNFKDVYDQLQQAPTTDNNQPPANSENNPVAGALNNLANGAKDVANNLVSGAKDMVNNLVNGAANVLNSISPSKTLSASVGEGGTNKPEDVALVKTLINKFIDAFTLSDTANLGKVGPTTIKEIKRFQQEKVGLSNPDGRIDVGGQSWKVLSGEVQPKQSANTGGNTNVPAGGKIAHPNPAGELRSPFGMRLHPILGVEKMHTGVDFASGAESPIYAADAGKVDYFDEAGYGTGIEILHANGYSTLYCHLSSRSVANGSIVKKGDVIGREGTTGRSTGIHLHFEVRINDQPQDPMPYINGSKQFS